MIEFTDDELAAIKQRVLLINHSAILRGATGVITFDEWINKLREHGLSCHYCHVTLTVKRITVDHQTPLSRGGLHHIDNIVPACINCNRLKHTQSADDFIASPIPISERHPKLQTNIRLSQDTRCQIAELARWLNINNPEVVALAIDRAFQHENEYRQEKLS